jgi:DNA-binding NtrC family response regulator
MKNYVLVADDDMSVHKLMCDVLEISLKGVKIERAMSPQCFWAKLPAPPAGQPWQLVFISADYIREEPEGFIDRIREVNPDAVGKVVVVGDLGDTDSPAFGEEIKRLPSIVKPFSLDKFDELVKGVCG